MIKFKLYYVPVAALTEVEGHRGVVVCFTVSDEVDLVLPLLLLQPVFGAAVVAHAAAAQNEDDHPHQPKPYGEKSKHRHVVFKVELSRFLNVLSNDIFNSHGDENVNRKNWVSIICMFPCSMW